MGMQPAKRALDIGVVVKDIEASLAFYQDLLGLEKVQEVPLWFGTMHRMAFGDSFVKLIDPKVVPEKGTYGLDTVLGIRYLTFQISNIDEVCRACAAAGVEFEREKDEFMPGVTIAMVRDPDDNIVEFVQRAG